jgi:hypothetical protein
VGVIQMEHHVEGRKPRKLHSPLRANLLDCRVLLADVCQHSITLLQHLLTRELGAPAATAHGMCCRIRGLHISCTLPF